MARKKKQKRTPKGQFGLNGVYLSSREFKTFKKHIKMGSRKYTFDGACQIKQWDNIARNVFQTLQRTHYVRTKVLKDEITRKPSHILVYRSPKPKSKIKK